MHTRSATNGNVKACGILLAALLGWSGCGRKPPEAPPAPVEAPPAPVPAGEALPVYTDKVDAAALIRALELEAVLEEGTAILLSVTTAWDAPSNEDDRTLERVVKDLETAPPVRFLSVAGEAAGNRGDVRTDRFVERSAGFRELGFRALPTRVLLDAQGQVRGWYPGYAPHQRIEEELRRLR